MLGSLSHSDINSSYSLFSYFALISHRQYNSLQEILVILIVVTLLIVGSDIWALALLQYEEIGEFNRIFGYVWIVGELALKLVLLGNLIVWKLYKTKLLVL